MDWLFFLFLNFKLKFIIIIIIITYFFSLCVALSSPEEQRLKPTGFICM